MLGALVKKLFRSQEQLPLNTVIHHITGRDDNNQESIMLYLASGKQELLTHDDLAERFRDYNWIREGKILMIRDHRGHFGYRPKDAGDCYLDNGWINTIGTKPTVSRETKILANRGYIPNQQPQSQSSQDHRNQM